MYVHYIRDAIWRPCREWSSPRIQTDRSIILHVSQRASKHSQMPSNPWTEVLEPYITKVDGSREVAGFLTELSKSFDGSACANHLNPCQLAALRVSLTCMKDEWAMDESQQSVLANLLQDAQTFQARMQYIEPRTHFDPARCQVPSLLCFWKSTADNGNNPTSPLGYILDGCDKVISNGLNAEGTPQERAQAHLDF